MSNNLNCNSASTSSLWLCYHFIISLAFIQVSISYNNGVALKPAMGWNTWCSVSFCGSDRCTEQEVKGVAQAMKSNGMFDIGYDRINLDDCWENCGNQGEDEAIMADPVRFPSGMPDLIEYVHDLGYQFGLYTSAGTQTCSRGLHCVEKPRGSYGHYQQDANTFAEWKVDYVKVDWCGHNYNSSKTEHSEFSRALNNTGRHMWLELCRGYGYPPPAYVATVANSWRVSGDHKDHWINTKDAINEVAGQTKMSGPHNWAYNDMLMTGGEGCPFDVDPNTPSHHCPGMTKNEYRTEFSIWAITASPLLVATDVRNMTEIMKEVLLNTEIIAVNQNYLMPAGDRIESATVDCDSVVKNACQTWTRKMDDNDIAVVLYNAGDSAHDITVQFDILGMGWNANSNLKVRDLWMHSDLGSFTGAYTAHSIPIHGVSFVIISSST